MRLLIPTIGTEMTLDAPWTFTLHQERRNQKFANDNFQLDWQAWPDWNRETKQWNTKTHEVTLPAGTTLKVVRVYIRSSSKDSRNFDSVTFTVVKQKGSSLRGRFWAKLVDVNSMEVFFDIKTTPIREAKGVSP